MNQREYYEWGLLGQLETLAMTLDVYDQNDRSDLACWERIYGYISAGMYTDIISVEEFHKLSDEVRRWQFSC